MLSADSTYQSTQGRRSGRLLWWLASVVALALGAVALWPATEEADRIQALGSTDLDEVVRAAELLAASGKAAAVGPLREARQRLLERKKEEANRDLIEFADLPYDLMIQRISDRRQSSGARRLWLALGAVNRAIAILDPQSAAAQKRPAEEWELPTQEEWESRAGEPDLPTGEPGLPTAEESQTRAGGEQPEAEERQTLTTPAEDLPVHEPSAGSTPPSQDTDPQAGSEVQTEPEGGTQR